MTDYSNLTLDQLDNMTNEEFEKLDPTQFPNTPAEAPVEHQEEQVPNTPEADVPPVEQEVPAEDNTPQPSVDEPASEAVPNEQVVEDNASRAGTEPSADGSGTPEVKETTPTASTAEKDFFDKVTAKFQANGREFQITSADDVVSLMQKGLNYNQKMAAFKPSMKLVRALQDKGIESVDQLGVVFDLLDGKPEALAKVIKDKGIDAYDLNEEKAGTYNPSVPEVSDELINFEMVAKGLEGNPNFATVVTELNGFDAQTKQQIFANPGLLNVLTDHVASGQYGQIVARLEQERALGRYMGVPFLQAYDDIGIKLFAQPQQVQQPVAVQPVPVPVATKPNTVNNSARQAAGGTPGSTAPVSKQTGFTLDELYNMSDDDFAKINPKFLAP